MKEKVIFLLTVAGLIGLTYENVYGQRESSYKRGVLGAMIFISVMGSLRPSNPFKSWDWLYRFQLWLAICYNAILVFLVFQNEKEARELMKLGDARLGVPVVKSMHTYDDNCEVEWANIVDNLDHYYWGHVINWLLAAFLVRDTWYLNFWSILDELIELSWQHKLPHFRECWWDHVFLDVLLSNTVSIFVGMWIIRKLRLVEYDWLGRRGKRSWREWGIWHSKAHFESVFVIFTIVSVNFLDGFFLMNQLWVPPKTWMVVYRLLIWFSMGHIAFRELHNALHDEREPFQARFLTYFTIVVESWVSIKFLKDCGNLQEESTPWYITAPWLAAGAVGLVHYWRLSRGKAEK